MKPFCNKDLTQWTKLTIVPIRANSQKVATTFGLPKQPLRNPGKPLPEGVTIHFISLLPRGRGVGQYGPVPICYSGPIVCSLDRCSYDAGRWFGTESTIFGVSEQPVFDAARYLLEHKLAKPDGWVATFRDGILSLHGAVGECAKVHIQRQ